MMAIKMTLTLRGEVLTPVPGLTQKEIEATFQAAGGIEMMKQAMLEEWAGKGSKFGMNTNTTGSSVEIEIVEV